MILPFKTPVRIEDNDYIVAADNELIMQVDAVTREELTSIVAAINAAPKLATLLKEARETMLDGYGGYGDWAIETDALLEELQ